MARHTRDLSQCLVGVGPALQRWPDTEPTSFFGVLFMLGAGRKAVDHVLIWCLDIVPTVARLCTNRIIFCVIFTLLQLVGTGFNECAFK